jgi:hypothetical protein
MKRLFSTSTQNALWNTSGAMIDFTGTGTVTQIFHINGINGNGYTNNFAWGTIDITGTETVELLGSTGGTALYVDKMLGLVFSGGTIGNLVASGIIGLLQSTR